MRLLDKKSFSILALALLLPFPWSFQYSVIDRFAISIFPCLQPLYLVADQPIQVKDHWKIPALYHSVLPE